MEHWTDDFEHSTVNDENREAFNKHMVKFATKDDAVADAFGLAKLKGAPFKLPKDLEGMDETARGEFMPAVHKLLNIRHAKSVDELKDVNLKDGLAEGANFDEDFANEYKKFVVENKMNTSDMPKNAKFFNTIMAKLRTDAEAKANKEAVAAREACNKALIEDPDIGSEENLKKQTELFKRAFQKHLNLKADEVEKVGEALAAAPLLTTYPPLAKILLKQFAPLAATADLEDTGGPDAGKNKIESVERGSPSSDAIWGSTEEEKKAYQESIKTTAPA
jgi:hypothetical protein